MIEIIECDFNKAAHCQAVIKLMNAYMADEMGGSLPPHSSESADKLITGLRNHPSKLTLLAWNGNDFVGLSNSFVNFGTFASKSFINIHDVVVSNASRGLGIGRKIMDAIIARAMEIGCNKITLEVREDNVRAKALYSALGFAESRPVMHFWTKCI
jgi:ribosomal protein S18 acetylase RimI-like enzyme